MVRVVVIHSARNAETLALIAALERLQHDVVLLRDDALQHIVSPDRPLVALPDRLCGEAHFRLAPLEAKPLVDVLALVREEPAPKVKPWRRDSRPPVLWKQRRPR